MLWYKAWLETRVRFLICLIAITYICSYDVFRRDTGVTSPVNDAYYHSAIHNSDSQLAIWWLVAITLLTMGGLLREKAVGAATFTLALPFSRARLVGVRMAMSLMQALALIIIPWSTVFLIASVAGKTHSITQALFHLALLVGGGVVLFAIGFLVSCVVEGEYTAPLVSGGIVMAFAFALEGPKSHSYSPILFMLGARYYDPRSGLLTGPVPWIQIAVYAIVAVLLVGLSIQAIRSREF